MCALAHILQGNLTEAERETDAISKLVPRHYFSKSLRAMIAAARGDRASAETALKSFEADANQNHWAAIRVAQVHARLGDRKKAVAWVQKSAELGHHNWYAVVKHPWLQSLQTDRQFQQVLTKIKSDLDDVSDDVIGVYQLLCGS
jgi:tetratricopeptide (TPR) repeat protein